MMIANAVYFHILSIQPKASLRIEMKRTETKSRFIGVDNTVTSHDFCTQNVKIRLFY